VEELRSLLLQEAIEDIRAELLRRAAERRKAPEALVGDVAAGPARVVNLALPSRLAVQERAAEHQRLWQIREPLAYQGSHPNTLARKAGLIELAHTIRRRGAEEEGRPYE
jgi:hypothetical protein